MDLVCTEDHGIKGESYYWTRRERFDISVDELSAVGITSGRAYVSQQLLRPLRTANDYLGKLGYELFIKDGYRSAAAYELAHRKVAAKKGQTFTVQLFNMIDKPHATGLAIDVVLLHLDDGTEVMMRDGKEDAQGAWKIGYYLGSSDPIHCEYQRLQVLLIGVMTSVGFKLGKKREYWHFEYILEH